MLQMKASYLLQLRRRCCCIRIQPSDRVSIYAPSGSHDSAAKISTAGRYPRQLDRAKVIGCLGQKKWNKVMKQPLRLDAQGNDSGTAKSNPSIMSVDIRSWGMPAHVGVRIVCGTGMISLACQKSRLLI